MSVYGNEAHVNVEGREVIFPVNESISHATLRTEDLIEAFESWIESVDPKGYTELMEEKDDDYADDEWLNEVLFDAMNDYAPEGYYFGATEGDGSDFGFWEYSDNVEETR
jgi:hypothetical protein